MTNNKPEQCKCSYSGHDHFPICSKPEPHASGDDDDLCISCLHEIACHATTKQGEE